MNKRPLQMRCICAFFQFGVCYFFTLAIIRSSWFSSFSLALAVPSLYRKTFFLFCLLFRFPFGFGCECPMFTIKRVYAVVQFIVFNLCDFLLLLPFFFFFCRLCNSKFEFSLWPIKWFDSPIAIHGKQWNIAFLPFAIRNSQIEYLHLYKRFLFLILRSIIFHFPLNFRYWEVQTTWKFEFCVCLKSLYTHTQMISL